MWVEMKTDKVKEGAGKDPSDAKAAIRHLSQAHWYPTSLRTMVILERPDPQLLLLNIMASGMNYPVGQLFCSRSSQPVVHLQPVCGGMERSGKQASSVQ